MRSIRVTNSQFKKKYLCKISIYVRRFPHKSRHVWIHAKCDKKIVFDRDVTMKFRLHAAAIGIFRFNECIMAPRVLEI